MLVTQGSTGDSFRRGIGGSRACEPETWQHRMVLASWNRGRIETPSSTAVTERLLSASYGLSSQAAGEATLMLLAFIIIDWPLSWYRAVLAGKAKRSPCPIH